MLRILIPLIFSVELCQSQNVDLIVSNDGSSSFPQEMIKFAHQISTLFYKQSFFNHPESQNASSELISHFRQRFFGTICDKNVDRDEFIEYLNKQREYHEIDDEISKNQENHQKVSFRIISTRPSLIFNIHFNVTHLMDVINDLMLKVDADINSEGLWKIREVRIGGGCVDSEHFDRNYLYSHRARKLKTNRTVDEIIKYYEENITQVINNLDSGLEGIVENDPMFTETYKSNDFWKFMKIFNERYTISNDTSCSFGKAQTVVTLKEEDHVIIRIRRVVKYLLTGTNDLWEFQLEAVKDKTSIRDWQLIRIYIRPMYPLPNRPIYELTNSTKNEFQRIVTSTFVQNRTLKSDLLRNLKLFRTCSNLYTSDFEKLELNIFDDLKMSKTKKPEIFVKVLGSDKKYEPNIKFKLSVKVYSQKNEENKTDFLFFTEYDYKMDTYNIRSIVQACDQFGDPTVTH